MIDRYLEALEQYEMEIISVRKGRGAWICETDQGLKLLREYRGTVRRLEIEDQILGMIDTRTSLRTDRYERNREGGLLTMAGDGPPCHAPCPAGPDSLSGGMAHGFGLQGTGRSGDEPPYQGNAEGQKLYPQKTGKDGI